MKIATLLIGGALALATVGGAQATTFFGPATGAVAILGSPTVTLGVGTGTETFNAPVDIFATTGSLTSASGSGTVMGTINFSDTVGTTIPDVIPDFMTFNDTSGGTFTFNVASVQTIVFFSHPGVATSIGLYLLGTAGDSHLGLAQAPTSVTITSNQTGHSAFSASSTINAPPSGGVPEPATWAMMLVGFGLVGGTMRLRTKELAGAA